MLSLPLPIHPSSLVLWHSGQGRTGVGKARLSSPQPMNHVLLLLETDSVPVMRSAMIQDAEEEEAIQMEAEWKGEPAKENLAQGLLQR